MNVNDCIIGQDIILLLMSSCSGEELTTLLCDVYCQTKDVLFFGTFTRESAAVMQTSVRLWVKHIDRVLLAHCHI
jgi:hypothetical protein